MKQRKFDYKIKKSEKISESPRNKHKYPTPRPKKYLGLFIIITVFLTTLVIAYYTDFFKGFKSAPIKKDITFKKIISHINHFLIFNVTTEHENKLDSVVMVSFFQGSNNIVLSFFPSNLSLDNNHTLDYYFKGEGASGLSAHFFNYFKLPFQYINISEKFYAKASREIKNIIVSSQDKNHLSVPDRILKDIHKNKQLFLIEGKNINSYLMLNNQPNTVDQMNTKRNHFLHMMMSFFYHGQELSSKWRFLYDQIISQSPNVKDIHSNLSDHSKKILLESLNNIKLVNVFTYPFILKYIQNKFIFTSDSSHYKHFLQFIKTRIDEGKSFTARHYHKIIQSIDRNIIQNNVRIKIIDRSGRGNQSEQPSFRRYFNFLNCDIISYYHEKKSIDESYLINTGYNHEVLSYIKGIMRINRVYDSVDYQNKSYDLILVIGKDFPEISSGN